MTVRPPVQPQCRNLPFHDSSFGWDTFEQFCCDFLNAKPEFSFSDAGTEIRRRVISARLFGRRGDVQNGIDILAEMEGGEIWDFQCKHVKNWGPQNTRDAIASYNRDSPRRFLLVTCDVSEKCHEIIARHPGWQLWDAREINRRFRELNPLLGAPILFTNFGHGWAETFFGISGDNPLIGAEAKYQKFLVEGRRFHHRHALIGRTKLLANLDAFMRDERARVFIITGRGGLGKSRLLLHWSRLFNQHHPEHTLRFVSDKHADFGPVLRTGHQPLAIVFDDAHRFDEIRRALFPEIQSREQIKLILALRPGPVGQAIQELLDVGFDSTQIVEGEPIKSLTSEQTLELIDRALKPEFARYRHFLRSASRDCPLIAVIGAELINSDILKSGDLIDENELQLRVFKSLLDDADWVRNKFGNLETDDFLRLLALLGPLKLDDAFFLKAAPFLGMQQAAHVSHLRDSLDEAGLLHTTGAGTRITPDLLSDHLVYTACYDQKGQSRRFSERVLEQFSPEEFPKLIQHLAEAEWRALEEKADAASIVEPLWQWFRNRLVTSQFFERHTQIQEWANIAYIQPERSLELAELAISLKTVPAKENGQPIRSEFKWGDYDYSIKPLQRMLVNIAEHHSYMVERCLDLLWQFGRNQPVNGDFPNEHPITLIGEVITFKHWKGVDVSIKALDWLELLLCTDEWMAYKHTPGSLLSKFIEPCFETRIEEHWSAGRTFHIRPYLVNIPITQPVRDRALALCRKLIKKRDPFLANQLIHIVEKGCESVRFGGGDAEYIAAWDEERLKALSVMEELLSSFSEPLIYFQIRTALMRYLRYSKGSSLFQNACRKVIDSIPDSLDFRIARATLGDCYHEFDRDVDDPDWSKKIERRWRSFVKNVATSIREKYSDITSLLNHLVGLDEHWRAFKGAYPNFHPLFMALAEKFPSKGVEVAEIFLKDPTHPLAYNFEAVVLSATNENKENRLRLIKSALAENALLQAAAVTCCVWWRQAEELPEEAWKIIEALAPNASPNVADKIVNYVLFNRENALLRDWNILASLPFAPGETALSGRIADSAARLLDQLKNKPDESSVRHFINRFESLNEIDGHYFETAFPKLAEAFPTPMFLMLWRRSQTRKSGNVDLKGLPYKFELLRFPGVMDTPEVKSIFVEFENGLTDGNRPSFEEKRLLRLAIHHGSNNPREWLEAAAKRSSTEDQLDIICELGTVGVYENAALAFPDFASVLLICARAIGDNFHERIFNKMLYIGGGRGSTDGKPDAETESLFQAIEFLVNKYESDSELGPLFGEMLKNQKSFIPSQMYLDEIDADE